MADFYAIKRLAGSDLGWFRSLYHKFANTNLKGINLNADVFVDEFYRDIPVIAARQPEGHVRIGVEIFGPDAALGYPGTYKAVRSGASKNWRLNGTLVSDPPAEAGRFDILKPGDTAVFAFTGRPAPDRIDLVLLASAGAADAVMQTHFNGMIPRGARSMIRVAASDISAALNLDGVPPDHPLSFLVADAAQSADMDDAAAGGLESIRAVRTRRRRRPVTAAELAETRRRNEQTGADGERLVSGYLEDQINPDGCVVWASALDALSPYDFECSSTGGVLGDARFVLDVKSTRSAFQTPLHISMSELVYAAEADVPYYLYRVFDMTDDGGSLRVSEDVREWARSVLAVARSLPDGTVPDSFSVRPNLAFAWSDIKAIAFRDETEMPDLTDADL